MAARMSFPSPVHMPWHHASFSTATKACGLCGLVQYEIHHACRRDGGIRRVTYNDVPHVQRASFVHESRHSRHSVAFISTPHVAAANIGSHTHPVGTQSRRPYTGQIFSQGERRSTTEQAHRLTVAVVYRHCRHASVIFGS